MRALHLLGASIAAAAVGATLFLAHVLFKAWWLPRPLFASWGLPSDTWAVYVIAAGWCIPMFLGLVWPALALVESRHNRPLGPLRAAALAAVLTSPVTTALLTLWLHYPLKLELLSRTWNVYLYFSVAGLVFGVAYAWCPGAATTRGDRRPVGA